jgi:hypothetical protein
MGELLSKVIPLSLGAAVSPTVLALILVILGGKRAIARGAAFTAGVFTVLAGLTLIGLTFSHSASSNPANADIAKNIDGFAGILLLLIALTTILRTRLHRDDPAADPKPKPETNPSLHRAYLLGIVMMLVNFSTILLYLPAMREISDSRVAFDQKTITVILAILITSVTATIPLLVRIVAPGPAERAFTSLHALVSRHQRQIGLVIEIGFGAYLLFKAVR